MIVGTTKIASGDSVRSPPPLRGLSDWDRLVISSFIHTVTSRCSTELRINSSQAEERRITGLALTHGLRIAACNFDVGLRGGLDELTFVEYLRDGDFPLCAGSTHESRERTQNRDETSTVHKASRLLLRYRESTGRHQKSRYFHAKHPPHAETASGIESSDCR